MNKFDYSKCYKNATGSRVRATRHNYHQTYCTVSEGGGQGVLKPLTTLASPPERREEEEGKKSLLVLDLGSATGPADARSSKRPLFRRLRRPHEMRFLCICFFYLQQ